MLTGLTRQDWEKQKAALEAFNRWEELQEDYLDLKAAMALWSDLLEIYRRFHPDDPPIDPEKYENLDKIRRCLAVLR